MKSLRLKRASSILEIIVAIGVFSFIATSVVTLYLSANSSNLRDKERLQATSLLQETLEATRSIRDYSMNNLTNGTYGLTQTNGYWELSGSSDTTGQYTRSVTIENLSRNSGCTIVSSGGSTDSVSKKITATVNWELESNNTTSQTAVSYLNDWRNETGCGQASYLTIDTAVASIGGAGNKELQGITLTNTGSTTITIDTITATWTNGQQINEITIDANSVWKHNGSGSPSGRQSSGTELDIVNHTINPSTTSTLDAFAFQGDMTGDSFTILFTMSDGTGRYAVITPSGGGGDATAPDAITDLTASNATNTSIDLSWTAPGDDGNTGTASSYDIRYSTSTITEANWSTATQVLGEPTPSIAGTSESMTISTLLPNTTYYFAIKTADEVPNTSAISNNTSETTTTIIGNEADSLSVNSGSVVLSGDNLSINGITIENTGISSITISSITVSWTGISSGTKLKTITINNIDQWTGNNSSGQIADITDFTLLPLTSYSMNNLTYSKSISGITISITFTMSDGSTKTVSSITP